MSGMRIHWKIERLDEGEDEDPRNNDCLLKIEGRIECGGREAGVLEAHYLFVEDPETDAAFLDFWDLDATTCAVFEEIMDDNMGQFRYPIPWHLDDVPGIICVHFIALRPEFRGIGMGRAAMDGLVHDWADPRIGVILLDGRPLQHRPRGYEDFDGEVRDLPWNSPQVDRERLTAHFESWKMETVPKTRFLAAPPAFLNESRAETWPPAEIYGEEE